MIKESIKDQQQQIISGVFTLKPNIFEDERGLFFESWNKKTFAKYTKKEIAFVQDNYSLSKKGVLRGLHFQLPPYSQGKLIRVLNGEIFDVFVDLRRDSKTFKSWGGVILNNTNRKQIWIPNGFAHGFLSLKDQTEVSYKVDNYWDKKSERTLIWKDKDINIQWPKEIKSIKNLMISDKDCNGFFLSDFFKKGELF
mgnify:CR=1 FL=1